MHFDPAVLCLQGAAQDLDGFLAQTVINDYMGDTPACLRCGCADADACAKRNQGKRQGLFHAEEATVREMLVYHNQKAVDIGRNLNLYSVY